MPTPTQLAGIRILVVEDDPDAGELLVMALEDVGASATLARSGAAAMDELSTAIPDLLLCDLTLPDGSGLEWLRKFRTVSGCSTIPAIALSGHASTVDRERSLAGGFATHLNKPARLSEVFDAIRTARAAATPLIP